MRREVLIISAAGDFGSELGLAIAQGEAAWRVSLVDNSGAALTRAPQGIVLLDGEEEEAAQLARTLRQSHPELVVHFTPRAEGVEAALAQLQAADPAQSAAALEPLAGDESDARYWHYIREPEFLRDLVPAAAAAAAEGRQAQQPAQASATADTRSGADSDDQSAAGLTRLAQETGALAAMLTRDGRTVARAGQLDAPMEAGIRALAADGPGSQAAARLFLVDFPALPEPCLLFVRHAGALQLSLLVPDDRPARALRLACDRFLET